ncbi:aminoglycoside adenylyltransferase domain-containing protein [Streptomyces sp. NPDC052023]|uniref:aminoglycoside adenylyltransferase domain-containing protein n=1 Tax=Streptomyces sp. NPDC052023 TaxID=3365681 RepID=UPI0037D550B7
MPTARTTPLVRLLRHTLGNNILGLCLHGSATLAGLRPQSDIDLLVELVVVRRDEVNPWRYPPNCEFLCGEWLREEYERGFVPGPATMPDLAPLLTMALHGDAPLHGPPPADLLALARVRVTLATGTIRSKDAAADWALERLPPEQRPALARARAEYLGLDVGAAPEGARRCADALVRRLRAVADQPS